VVNAVLKLEYNFYLKGPITGNFLKQVIKCKTNLSFKTLRVSKFYIQIYTYIHVFKNNMELSAQYRTAEGCTAFCAFFWIKVGTVYDAFSRSHYLGEALGKFFLIW